MLCQLPAPLVAEKLHVLTSRIRAELGVEPRSFRAGRWGFGRHVAGALTELGYVVDSSVTPFLDWSDIGGPDYSHAPPAPYRFRPGEPLEPSDDGPLLELPSTVGFLGRRQATAGATRAWLERNKLGRHSRVVGLLDRAGFLRRRWLSPEHSTTREMIQVSEAWVASGFGMLAMTFHSPTLFAGLTPFVRSTADLRRFVARIEEYLKYCVDRGFEFATLSEAAVLVDSGALPTSRPSGTPSPAPSSP
jgi:hypothetical protein